MQYNELFIFLSSRADFDSLRDDFNKLYEKDYPQLQRCLEKLRNIIRKFERDFRRATKKNRNGGAVGMAGLFAGLALAPFTGGASLAVARAAAAGGGLYGGMSSFEKKRKITKLSQDIEAELKEFQNIINPMSEKMRDINERIEEILKELDRLEQEAGIVSEYFASKRRKLLREEMIAVTAQISITMGPILTI